MRDDFVVVTFQSRFGKAEWLQPYTEPTLVALAKAGVARVDVFCPGFTSDCLETLEEIDQEARAAFIAAGGKQFGYIPCLNDQHEWLAALAGVAVRHLQGWDTAPAAPTPTTASRRSAGAPSPPARRPEHRCSPTRRERRLQGGIRPIATTVPARDSRHLRGPRPSAAPTRDRTQRENDMRHTPPPPSSAPR